MVSCSPGDSNTPLSLRTVGTDYPVALKSGGAAGPSSHSTFEWTGEFVEGRRRGQRMRQLEGITDSLEFEFEQAPGVGEDREAWRAAVHWVAERQIQLSD